MNYYNENDPPTAAWLAQLIHDRLIPMGYVDERSITEVMPADLKGFTQCHFFAGIGGWSYALQLAGWPTTRPVWTGSCPCQPFSVAGKRKGSSDERHLWPEFYRLIKECKPSTVLESRLQARMAAYGSPEYVLTWKHWASGPPICALRASVRHISGKGSTGAAGWVTPNARDWKDTPGMSQTGVNPDGSIRKKIDQLPASRHSWGDNWISCADGKARRIEPRITPLAHGIPARVGLIRGYGNAIVPQVAAEFILACG